MKRVAIIGAGDLGQQIAYYINSDTKDQVVGYFDDYCEQGMEVHGQKILGRVSDVLTLFQQERFDEIILAIGYKHLSVRKSVFKELSVEMPFYTFIHSTAIIDASASIGAGAVIYPGCLIDQQVHVGENCILNVGCAIAHHTEVAAHCFLSPRVAIAGFSTIGVACSLGINSTVIDNIKIVSETKIGGGGVVIKSIEKPGLYVGNPVRFVR